MREILFRGKQFDNGEWIYGFLVRQVWSDNTAREPMICFGYDCSSEPDNVLEETIGEFTGLCDKNGTRIFEGDVVKCNMVAHSAKSEYKTGIVKFIDGCFDVFFEEPFICFHKEQPYNRHIDYVKCFTCNHALEVIGNKFDNPELLEVK